MIIVLRDSNVKIVKELLSDFSGKVVERGNTLMYHNTIYHEGSAMRVTFNEDGSITVKPEELRGDKEYGD